jgi:hypothetical protein
MRFPFWLAAVPSDTFSAQLPPYRIHAKDSVTGRGIPRVTFATMDASAFVTDSLGNAAVDVSGRENLRVFFSAATDGYYAEADDYGFRGLTVVLTPGGSANISLVRTQKAERLYRLTGFGVYADSVALGISAPTSRPILNAGVVGQDSVLSVQYGERAFWFWGDTNKLGSPLGNFFSTGATSCLLSNASCMHPDAGVDLEYFSEAAGGGQDEFVRPMAAIDPPGLPTWLGSVAVVADSSAASGVAMTASFVKPDHSMNPTRVGLLLWDDAHRNFSEAADWPLGRNGSGMASAAGCCGHAVTNRSSNTAGRPPTTTVTMFDTVQGGREYVVFAGRGTWPLSVQRCQADVASLKSIDQYESFTPLLPGSTPAAPRIARDQASGELLWAWRGAPALGQELEEALVQRGLLRPSEVRQAVFDQDGRTLAVSGGSVHWNAYRRKFIAVFGARPNERDAHDAAAAAAATVQGAGGAGMASAAAVSPIGVGRRGGGGRWGAWGSGGDVSYDVEGGQSQSPRAGYPASRAWQREPPPEPAPSNLGELYFAESASLSSGWSNATRIVTHSSTGYSCYNPLQLPLYDSDDGERIYVTCTMTTSFSSDPAKEPRYDYNNQVFGLSLSSLLVA